MIIKGVFNLKDKKILNPYISERKIIYFIAENISVVETFIRERNLDWGYDFSLDQTDDNIDTIYPTDGFTFLTKRNVGKMDLRLRDFLIEAVIGNKTFDIIVKSRNDDIAINYATTFLRKFRYAYFEDAISCTATDNSEKIEEKKANGKRIYYI